MRRMSCKRAAQRRRQMWPELHEQKPVENKQAGPGAESTQRRQPS
ncbi:hypothetical protein Dolphis_3 [Pseudomonas phage Dolphis]|nr:hypothetical protein Dolphis_3 [Pseudomonas phage Dolphis]